MKYQVVLVQDSNMNQALKELSTDVMKLCSKGWKPQGGISIAVKDYNWCYVCQAMVKEDD